MRKVAVLTKALVFLIILLIGPSRSANMSDYCYVPPFVGTSVKPNVLIVMDFSGSMQFPAYVPCNFGGYPSNNVAECNSSTSSYNPNQTYAGYFDPNKCYQYSSSFFQEANCNCSNRIGSSSCISGNLLNWVTATRIDIARMVLTGGRTSPSGGNTFLESEGSVYTIKENKLKCKFEIKANTTNNRQITISNNNGNCPLGNNAISKANIKIRPSDPNSIRGIIHSFCDTSDLNGQVNEKCQLIMEFMVFASDGRYGKMKTGKNETLASLISAINKELPYQGTPTGEALWEAYDFYKQSNDYNYEANSAYINRGNGNVDPYYDGSGGNSYPVPCRKSFVLLISDGAWNGNVDPVVPARIMATQDLRSDLPGKQNVYTYAVYAFGDLDPGTSLQGRQAMITTAIFGGFEDLDSNTWPFPFTGIQYPNGSGTCSSLGSTVRTNIQTTSTTYCNSRGVTYPLPQCNPPNNWDPKCAEWDTVGNSSKDGLPYNFFEANDAESLRNALLSAFSEILKRASSGATVATLASRYQTSSVVLQPAFYPEYITQEGKPIRWLGTFRGYWVDSGQNLREDTVMDKILILLGQYRDKVFTFFFDANKETKVALFDADPNQNPGVCSSAQIKSPIQLRPTLQFDCILASTSKDARKIYFNDNGNLREFKSFNRNEIKPAWTFIDNSLTDGQVDCVIEYLRGEYDYTWNCTPYVMRKRVFDVSQICYNFAQGSNAPWKIGPIVYSTPTVAGNQALNQKYTYVYNDDTYREYVLSNSYKNRRSVSFVASNIGMLHFFRIGHLKETGDTWQPIKLVNDPSSNQNDLVEKEEFAFIPQNALPYMLWYGKEDYCSLNKGYIPIVDYRMDVFDASFDRNDDPNGNKTINSWNTYLLGTMGVGGKQLGSYSSSVFLLKLTNYLNDNTGNTLPELMWEIKLDGGALATSFPARVRQGDSNKNGKWYFVLGSGPKDPNADSYDKFLSDPKLYVINARNGSVHTVALSSLLPNNVNAAVGDVIEFDIDNDYQDDVIYFGMYGYKNNGSSWGGIYRIALKTQSGYKDPSTITINDIKEVVELDDFKTGNHIPPVFAAVTATKDESGRLWVYLNTGLYLSPSHRTVPYKNYIIGVIDECWDNVNKYFKSTCEPVRKVDLADAKSISGYVNVNGGSCDSSVLNFTQTTTENMCVCGDSGCSIGQAVKSTNALTDFCVLQNNKKGWFYELDGYIAYSRPALSFGVLMTEYFKPSDDPCTPVGETFITALRYNTGLPPANPPFIAVGNTEGSKLKYSISIGYGSPPLGEVFRIIRDTAGNLSVIGQTSTGAIFNVRQQIGGQVGRFVLWIEK